MFGRFKKKRKPSDMPEGKTVKGCWSGSRLTRWVHKVNGVIYYLDSRANNPREAKIDYWKPIKKLI